ncbi:MAG: hypothetical protein QM594_17610 [Niabella sp.]
MIPQTFEQWQHCIVHDCRMPLTKDFARSRLAIYKESNHPETKKFVQLYGTQHLQNIIEWLGRVAGSR